MTETPPNVAAGSPPLGKRLRARGVLAVRYGLTQPVARRVPVAWAHRLHRLRRRLAPRRYTDADPLRLIEIDPARITGSVLPTAPKRPQWGRVIGGDWDREAERFADRAVVRGVREHFEDGVPWRETALFDAFREQLSRFGNAWGYRTLDGFEPRCREIERLYTSLSTEGYRRREELTGRSRPVLLDRADEINVDVGRDGTLYWRAYGQHRLAIAQLLGLKRVPVLCHRRHRRWQARRERGRITGRFDGMADHPDIDADTDTPSRSGRTGSSGVSSR